MPMNRTHTRRDFLRISAAGTFGAFILTQLACRPCPAPASQPLVVEPKTFHIGLQLYTVRDALAQDLPGTLELVSDAGYAFVELAGYTDGKFYGYAPTEFKRLVSNMGLEIVSSHTQVEARGITLENAKRMAEDHAEVGAKYCIQPWVVEQERKSLDRYRRLVAIWNQVGRIMKESGVQFGYHNHNFEFDTVEGKVPYYDVLLAELDASLVTMELDLFWAIKAGQDPVAMFDKFPGRFQLFHMKDMYTAGEKTFVPSSQDFAPVGAGIMDFKRIVAARDTAGLKYMIVEQDIAKDGNTLDAIKTSITNLKTKILI